MPTPVDVMSYSEISSRLSSLVRGLVPQGKPLEILEAGCGARWGLEVPLDQVRITGVDLDADALRRRLDDVGDIDVAIVGDLQDEGVVQPSAYDVVYSSFVLEHVPNAERAIANFYRWLRPGGTAIVIVPDARSAVGLITRLTPFWFHVWVYRHVFRIKQAGTVGHGPYRTHHSRVITTDGMLSVASDLGFEVAETHGVVAMADMGRIPRALASVFLRGLAFASFGRLTADYNNLAFVLRKPESDGGEVFAAQG